MYSESFLRKYSNWWSDEYCPSICYGIHPVIEEGKKTEMEEDEDE